MTENLIRLFLLKLNMIQRKWEIGKRIGKWSLRLMVKVQLVVGVMGLLSSSCGLLGLSVRRPSSSLRRTIEYWSDLLSY